MKIKFVLVVGAPASGKTGLVESILPRLGTPGKTIQTRVASVRNCNWAKGTLYPESKVVVLGVYDHSTYAGTDKLGRNVSPAVAALVQSIARSATYGGWSILAEGDRVTTQAFLDEVLDDVELRIVRLDVPPGVCAERQAKRTADNDAEWIKHAPKKVANKPRRPGRVDGVDPRWVQTRLTKLDNLCERYKDQVVSFPNRTPEDRDHLAEIILHSLTTEPQGVRQ